MLARDFHLIGCADAVADAVWFRLVAVVQAQIAQRDRTAAHTASPRTVNRNKAPQDADAYRAKLRKLRGYRPAETSGGQDHE